MSLYQEVEFEAVVVIVVVVAVTALADASPDLFHLALETKKKNLDVVVKEYTSTNCLLLLFQPSSWPEFELPLKRQFEREGIRFDLSRPLRRERFFLSSDC